MSVIYVISPVKADPDFAAKRAAIARAAARVGFQVIFPLDRQPDIALERAAADILSARFVIADLTYERPSCYFELGLAEATGADVAVIAKKGTPIHQIGYASAVNYYSDMESYEDLVNSLISSNVERRESARRLSLLGSSVER